jgi:hypothetical protein
MMYDSEPYSYDDLRVVAGAPPFATFEGWVKTFSTAPGCPIQARLWLEWSSSASGDASRQAALDTEHTPESSIAALKNPHEIEADQK